jgi:hypothetical protein
MSTTTEVTTKEAQVIASGISYFTEEPVRGPTGSVRTDALGNDINVVVRHEAVHGETVELTEYEFDRLSDLGAVREPSDAPLRPAQGTIATPFGVPVVDPETGLAAAFRGPVMGDPRPAGPDVNPTDLARGRPGALSPEEAARLQAIAEGDAEFNEDEVPFVDSKGGATPHVEAEQPGSGAARADVVPGAAPVPGNSLQGEITHEPLDGDYEDAPKPALEAEIERRNADRDDDEKIVVEGTGNNGNVIKDDLVAALEKDDDK